MNYRSLRIHDNVDYLLNVRAVDLAVLVYVALLGSRAATDLNLHCGNIGVLAVILGSIDAYGVCSSLSSIMYRTVDGELCYGIIYFGQPVTLICQYSVFAIVYAQQELTEICIREVRRVDGYISPSAADRQQGKQYGCR